MIHNLFAIPTSLVLVLVLLVVVFIEAIVLVVVVIIVLLLSENEKVVKLDDNDLDCTTKICEMDCINQSNPIQYGFIQMILFRHRGREFRDLGILRGLKSLRASL